jgi:hypothetical protein
MNGLLCYVFHVVNEHHEHITRGNNNSQGVVSPHEHAEYIVNKIHKGKSCPCA